MKQCCQYSCASVYWAKGQWSTKPHWVWVFLSVSVDDLC